MATNSITVKRLTYHNRSYLIVSKSSALFASCLFFIRTQCLAFIQRNYIYIMQSALVHFSMSSCYFIIMLEFVKFQDLAIGLRLLFIGRYRYETNKMVLKIRTKAYKEELNLVD